MTKPNIYINAKVQNIDGEYIGVIVEIDKSNGLAVVKRWDGTVIEYKCTDLFLCDDED